MAAPVIATLANPSASGSAAAASEPNTASRISRTIGKPIFSALSRSSLVRSCMPAQSACWPTRWGSTPPCEAVPNSSRKSTARSATWSGSPSTASGTTVIEADSASRFAAAAALEVTSACGIRSAIRATRSTSARTAAALEPSRRASTTARWSRCAPSKRVMFSSTICDCEPGTSKPPLVRCSVCCAAKGSAASRSRSQTARTTQRRRSRKAASLSMAACTGPGCLPGLAPPLCDSRHY